MFKWTCLLALATLAMGCDLIDEVSCADVSPDATMRLTPDGFEPATLTIRDGDVVRWINETDDTQDVVARNRDDNALEDDELESPNLAPGESFCAEFNNGNETYDVFSSFDPDTFDSRIRVDEN